MKTSTIVWTIIILILIGLGAYFLFQSPSNAPVVTQKVTQNQGTTTGTTPSQGNNQTGQTQAVDQHKDGSQFVIGKSVEGRDITANYYLPAVTSTAQAGGNGGKKILFVGGIHGGYEWNTALVAYELMDYLKANPSVIPKNVQVTVIPVMNPDGLNKVVGTVGRFTSADVSSSADVQVSGRFNANNVDLGRNFDCNWQPSGVWQTKTVSGGSAAFSEPESQAVRDYIVSYKPDAVVVWYSAAGGVFASSCGSGILPETNSITNIYAKASGYPAYKSFDFYKITGDMVDWLAKQNIPAISVLLSTHTDTEWTKNLAGIKAILEHYAQ